jgi:hypothetical protein
MVMGHVINKLKFQPLEFHYPTYPQFMSPTLSINTFSIIPLYEKINLLKNLLCA